MSQEKELYPNLVDASGVAHALAKVQEGDSPASKNSLIGFSFKDDSGNLVLPTLSTNGGIPVDLTPGLSLRARGKAVAPAVNARTMICEITLTLEKVYSELYAHASGTRLALIEVVRIDDSSGTPVETALGEFIISSGQFSFAWQPNKAEFNTIGGTGVQKYRVYGTNLDKASDLYASASLVESI